MTEISGVGALLILNMVGTYRRFAISRLMHVFVKNKALFERSMTAILNLDFENIVVSHGEPLLKNAKTKLKEALAERGYNL
jgi:hypothetical protein